MLNFIKNKLLKIYIYRYIIFVLLFVFPFFWFDNRLYLLGEDDTGLSYYEPYGSLLKFLSLWFSQDSLASFNPLVGGDALFAFILLVLKNITFNFINLQLLAFGFIFSFSFLYVVKLLELLTEKKSMAFYLAALFYIFSSYFMLVEYYYLMPSTYAILLIPIIYYYLIKSIKHHSNIALIYGAFWCFFLSRVLYTPVFINSFILLFIFILLYCLFSGSISKIRTGLYSYLKFSIFILLINSFIFVPSFLSLHPSSGGAINDSIKYRSAIKQSMVDNLKTELNINKLQYLLMNQLPIGVSSAQGFRNYPAYEYLNKYSFLVYIISIFALIGIITAKKIDKKILIPIISLLILSILIVSVDVFYIFEQFYIQLILNTPFFNMNRYPSLKFHIPFVLFYALFVGLGIQLLLNNLNNKYRKYLVFIIVIVLVIVNYQMITGNIFLLKSGLKNSPRAMSFNVNYINLVENFDRIIREDTKLALFPLGIGYGAFIPGESNSQMYRSTLTGFKNLKGYNLLGNLVVFSSPVDITILEKIKDYYFKYNVDSFLEVAEKINLKYIVYSKDISRFKGIGEVDDKSTYQSKQYYKVANDNQVVFENASYVIYKIKNYDEISQFSTKNLKTEVYFKKISDFMYLARIKTDDISTINFHESFNPLWNMYFIKENEFNCVNPINFAKKYPNVYECVHENNNILGNLKLLNYINIEKANFQHLKYKNYLNSWIINSNNKYIYVAFIMDGQKYILIGVVISIITILVFVTLIFKDIFKRMSK